MSIDKTDKENVIRFENGQLKDRDLSKVLEQACDTAGSPDSLCFVF